MRNVVNEDIKIIICGAVSFFLALLVYLLISCSTALHYYAIDCVNKLLFIPEYPFRTARDLVYYSGTRMFERENLRQQLARCQLQNRKQAALLQKAGIKVPPITASFVSARVVLRYPDNWWREAKINKGSADKIRSGAAVVSDGYLVGRITRVDKHSSWFEMITSSSFLMAAVIDETRDLGVVCGDNKGRLRMLYVMNNTAVKKNMKISTSLVGDQIPAGLMIGMIVGKEAAEEGYIPLKVSSGAHMTQLYDVEVYVDGVN